MKNVVKDNKVQPSPNDVVMPYLLDKLSNDRPNDNFAEFDSGEEWSYRRTALLASSAALALKRLSVNKGDKVIVWLPNGELSLKAWFSINWIGGVSVAINTAYKGNLLSHVLENSGAKIAFVHPSLLERLLDLKSTHGLKCIITDSEHALRFRDEFAKFDISLVPFDILETDSTYAPPVKGLKPWDEQSICYTSGTTGPSKGVISSYMHLYSMGLNCTIGVDANDRFLINLPLFHVGGTLFVAGALARGSSIGVVQAFSSDEFFNVCKAMRITQCLLLGAMAGFLMRSPASPKDKDHYLRRVMVIPLSEEPSKMTLRFGFDVYTLFNMSEISAPIVSDLNPNALGACGKLLPGYDAKVVDDNDYEVPIGCPGELILRSDEPWVLFSGYYKMPDATAKAWQNGWFHTGDMFKIDEQGNYYFVDRVKDAIRRRGENISSFEVESEVLEYPNILEAAAVGVPGDGGEEEVMIVVVPQKGFEINCDDLILFLSKRMPHYMVPKYIKIMSELPKTPTSKIEKRKIREEGVTDGTWDRSNSSIKIRREKF